MAELKAWVVVEMSEEDAELNGEIFGVFLSEERAEQAIERLLKAGKEASPKIDFQKVEVGVDSMRLVREFEEFYE